MFLIQAVAEQVSEDPLTWGYRAVIMALLALVAFFLRGTSNKLDTSCADIASLTTKVTSLEGSVNTRLQGMEGNFGTRLTSLEGTFDRRLSLVELLVAQHDKEIDAFALERIVRRREHDPVIGAIQRGDLDRERGG